MQDGDTGGVAFPCARLHSYLTKRKMLHLHGMSYEAAHQQGCTVVVHEAGAESASCKSFASRPKSTGNTLRP
jgi:hypothetical protein